jgi:L-alanine-DL-glutamate epimerase-like enolase superfamily enzyme
VRISAVRTHVLLDPAFDPGATSSAQDTIVVEVETDAGLVGIGESDVNAWVARACIEAPGTHTMDRGLGELLLGQDPLRPEEVWERLYVGTCMTGRRGALIHALGAIDIALWDLCGKAAGVPCWQLLGERAHEQLTPYASLQPETEDYDSFLRSIVDWAVRARDMGFRAVKLEATFDGPYVHKGLVGPDERIEEVVASARAAVGPEIALMVDVQYAFGSDVERALAVAERLAAHDVFFLETPLWVDDLAGYAELAGRSPVRIAAGEWLSSRHEFRQLLELGCVQVAQPDVGRVGGLTEARRICALAAAHEVVVVPHAWKTGISVAVAAHLAMVTPHMPFFEFLPAPLCESALRRELTRDELVYRGGALAAPARPGLGVELDRAALERFAEEARRLEAGARPQTAYPRQRTAKSVASSPSGPDS